MENFSKVVESVVDAITASGGRVEIHLDVESNGLRGVGFAIGGFVRQGKEELMEFSAIAPLPEGQELDGFVEEKIMPYLGDLPKVDSLEQMYEMYGELFFAVKSRVMELHGLEPWDTSDIRRNFVVVIDNGMPVEANFEAACWQHLSAQASEEDRFGVEMGGMYAPLDVSSVLDARGYNPDLPRFEVAEAMGVTGPKHHPVVDARQSAAVLDAAMMGTLAEQYKS